jgi:hypothetical protein
MKKRFTFFMVTGIIVIFSHLLSAKQQVGRIVGGEKGYIVERMVNGVLESFKAKENMALYPGDIISETRGTDGARIQMEFLPYAEPKKRGDTSFLIVFNPPQEKESVFTKLKNLLKLVEGGFYETSGASRGLTDKICLPGENATVFLGQEISFQNCRYGEAIVFKDLTGKVIFRKAIGEDGALLTLREIGMVPSGTYTWEIVYGEKVLYRSIIKQLSKEDSDLVKNDLKKIDGEAINTNQRRVKKAAYLQFISDLYHGSVNLYWLSYRLLKEINTEDENTRDLVETLKERCLIYFNSGISGLDFDILNAPGCLVAIEWEKGNEKKYVPPDFTFHENESFWIHFQTNFDCCALILYEDKNGPVPVFPIQSERVKIEAKTDRYSLECQLDGNAGNETFMFILSKKPFNEIKGLYQKVRKEGKELKVEFIGTKAFITTSEKELEGVIWFRFYLRNMGKN